MNRGLALQELDQLQEALACQDQALALDPNYAEAWSNRGNILLALKRNKEAQASYQRAIDIKPDYARAHCNMGNTLNALGKHQEAIALFKIALDFDPQLIEAHCNLGATYKELNRHEEALQSWHAGLALDPDDVDLHFNLMHLREANQQFDLAVTHINKLRSLNLPNNKKDFVGPHMFIKMHTCDWADLPQSIEEVRAWVLENRRPTRLLPLLAVTDDLTLLNQAAVQFTGQHYPAEVDALPEKPDPEAPKALRTAIGYFSSDFNHHAVSILTAELFELHDKAAFEVHAFSFNPAPRDATADRIAAAVDHYWACADLKDDEVLALARQQKIAVAIDLNGQTLGSRMSLFAKRLAPVQLAYLGFPGSLGTPYHDYILADDYLIPESLAHGYTERVMRLPCFQANDRRRTVSATKPSRAELGLPDAAVVYCCFNNTYKLTPTQFDAWMHILQQVEGSVLWLLGGMPSTQLNLQRRAVEAGVQPERLVFADRAPYADYMARYPCADLFLDTFPFNAGTTASDALWMGLPLLTYSGQSFASRMAGSLLHAVGLPELVARDIDGYTALAVALGKDRQRLEELRDRLKANRDSCALFDTPRLVRALEEHYREALKSTGKQ
jgi:tetratricopeptide (TPR) repeat protein